MCKREHVRAPSADVVPVYDGSGENLPLGPPLDLGTGDVKGRVLLPPGTSGNCNG